MAQARAGLEPVYERIREEIAAGADSPEFRHSVLESRLAVSEASRGSSRLRDNLSAPLLILMAIVGLVLVVACANIANLMLARAASRRRETAVCLAIGAGRLRLVRQRMAEALLLAALGGLGGLLLATWGTSVLATLISGVVPVSLDISPDIRVAAFAALTSCATAAAFGFWPALRATRIDPLAALKGSGGERRGARIPVGPDPGRGAGGRVDDPAGRCWIVRSQSPASPGHRPWLRSGSGGGLPDDPASRSRTDLNRDAAKPVPPAAGARGKRSGRGRSECLVLRPVVVRDLGECHHRRRIRPA